MRARQPQSLLRTPSVSVQRRPGVAWLAILECEVPMLLQASNAFTLLLKS